MRRLLPSYAETVDLDQAYAYPPEGTWVRANMVSSVDGAVAVEGRSEGLSGPADKKVFGVLRDLCDAVLVGAGTVRAEGYKAVRPTEVRVARRAALGLPEVPAIAVVSGSLDLDPGSGLFRGARVRTVLVTTERAARAAGSAYDGVADVVATAGDRVDLAAAIDALAERGLRRLLCEGGPMLLGSVTAAGRLDELCLTISPRLVSGGAARVLVGRHVGPLTAAPTQVLEEDGFLFTRYLVGRAPEDR